MNKVEQWKQEKHGLDVWPDIERFAAAQTPMKQIDQADLERMKWHGIFYRKRDTPESYMLRIRLTGCELTADQAKEIAYIAYELGYGIIDVTTRANIQVQGLSMKDLPLVIERLERCGLTARQTGHDNIRNVFCHPLSGIDPEELIDTRQLCHDITDLFVNSRVYSDLPRKLNISVSGREPHGLHYWTQDISYLAMRGPDGDAMFQVLLGGTQGQNPHLPWYLPLLVAPHQVVDVTQAILDLFREQGSRDKRDRARFRFLIERIGILGVQDWLEDKLPYPLMPHAAEPQPSSTYDELIGWFREKDPKRWAMGLCVPLGRLNWSQLEGLARLTRRWGDGNLRTTNEQGIMVTGVATGFKGAAATDAAALRLSHEADTLSRNTVACTGKQFCNIAVTDTKGHMLQLTERLRQRALALHGIRIHMSGCPSSCAQHHTADIGLKGVRVRRLLGTREGFDVYLGGGIAGRINLGILYQQGVDPDQLPQLIEEVTGEYYLKHKPGQTFSSYWRKELGERESTKAGDHDFLPPLWLCEGCGYQLRAEDPPVFCPSCAGLRRLFARLEEGDDPRSSAESSASAPAKPARQDGFTFAALEKDLSDSEGLGVEIDGRDIALFRVDGQVVAIDGVCPHEGAPLAQGTIEGSTVTCPWHGWTFDACTGCSIDPAEKNLGRYPTKLDDGKIFVELPNTDVASPNGKNAIKGTKPARPVTVGMRILEVIDESPDTKTFRLDNSAGQVPGHLPGQFLQVKFMEEGQPVWRSFTISSSPTATAYIDMTVKRNPLGMASNWLHDQVAVGDELTIRGPQGRFYFDRDAHAQPLVLISAGSGITPMMSILRYLADHRLDIPCTFAYGARTATDVLFAEECARIAQSMPTLRYHVRLSQPPADWQGPIGRVDFSWLSELVENLDASRFFLCGPGDFMKTIESALLTAGVSADRILQEAFGKAVPELA
jgi:ferredoxin-nitrite reductase